jgi:hypothetical protein
MQRFHDQSRTDHCAERRATAFRLAIFGGVTVTPTALAFLRLMTSLNLVGAQPGRRLP